MRLQKLHCWNIPSVTKTTIYSQSQSQCVSLWTKLMTLTITYMIEIIKMKASSLGERPGIPNMLNLVSQSAQRHALIQPPHSPKLWDLQELYSTRLSVTLEEPCLMWWPAEISVWEGTNNCYWLSIKLQKPSRQLSGHLTTVVNLLWSPSCDVSTVFVAPYLHRFFHDSVGRVMFIGHRSSWCHEFWLCDHLLPNHTWI